MGLKSNFASDQSLSGKLEQKASKHHTRAVDQKNLNVKNIFCSSPLEVKCSIGKTED